MAHDGELFQRYADAIRELPSGSLARANLLTPALLLAEEGALAMYYAPFDAVNERAKVILLGITPGFTQMALGYEQARMLVRAGWSADEVCRAAKHTAAFGGPMRANLVRMLDGIELHRHLGISSCEVLFDAARSLLHTTSAIRYPVFRNGQNYTGSNPSLTNSLLLRSYITTVLADELERVPQALVIPLGKSVCEAVQLLAAVQRLDLDRCLMGFPHPSGANGHREWQYATRREALQAQADAWFGSPSVTPVAAHAQAVT